MATSTLRLPTPQLGNPYQSGSSAQLRQPQTAAPVYGPVRPAPSAPVYGPARPAGQVLGTSTNRLSSPAPAPAPTPMNTSAFDAASSSAQQQNDALLSRLNSEYDYNAGQLQSQLGSLDQQKGLSLEQLNNEFSNVKNQVTTAKTNAQTNTEKQIAEAGATAQSIQGQNRNVLRALGILNSTAAGDLLSKPMNEFGKQRAALNEAFMARINELDNFMNERTSEHSLAVRQLEQQYTELVGKIQQDLRFNDRQRADAVQSANAALSQRLAEVQSSLLNYKNQVDIQKQTFAQQLQSMNNYTNPMADLTALSKTAYTAPTSSSQTTSIYQDPKKRSTSTSLLSDLGYNTVAY